MNDELKVIITKNTVEMSVKSAAIFSVLFVAMIVLILFTEAGFKVFADSPLFTSLLIISISFVTTFYW